MKDNSSDLYLTFNLGIGLLLTMGTLVLINDWLGVENLWVLVILGILVFGAMITLEERFLSKYINRFFQHFLRKE